MMEHHRNVINLTVTDRLSYWVMLTLWLENYCKSNFPFYNSQDASGSLRYYLKPDKDLTQISILPNIIAWWFIFLYIWMHQCLVLPINSVYTAIMKHYITIVIKCFIRVHTRILVILVLCWNFQKITLIHVKHLINLKAAA